MTVRIRGGARGRSPLRQRMISEIVDASYELARRRLMEGRYRAAEAAVVTGLAIEPGLERLWRIRITAAHHARDAAAEREAIDRMLAITDQLGGDLEPATADLLAALHNGHGERVHSSGAHVLAALRGRVDYRPA